MKKKILIVKNVKREGPGLLGQLLDEHKIGYEIVDLDAGQIFPDPKSYAALVVMGGPDSANDQTPKMLDEVEKVRGALDAGMPYLGICLGMQVLVKAAGGKVIQNPVKEIGWWDAQGQPYELYLTEVGRQDPLFAGLADILQVFQLHGETVETNKTIPVLAAGQHCRHQIVKISKRAYGIQCHFELTEQMLGQWLSQDQDLMPLDRNQVLEDFKKVKPVYEANGTKLLSNFLEITGLLQLQQ